MKAAKSNPRRFDWMHDVGISWSQRGDAYRALVLSSEALVSYREALAVMEGLSKVEPQNWRWPYIASQLESKISDVLQALGRHEDALAAGRRGLALLQRLAQISPDNPGIKRWLQRLEERVRILSRIERNKNRAG